MTKKTAEKKTTKSEHAAPKKTKAKAEKLEAKSHAPKARKAPKVKKQIPGKSCRVEGCKRSYRAKGYCKPHYRKWRHGEYGVARYKICSDGVCTKPMALNKMGFCEEHFQNYYVKGIEKPHAPAPAKPEQKAEPKAEKVAQAS